MPAGRIQAGDVLVIRYEGPKGGPGMPETFRALKVLNGRGRATKTAAVTDGRFSGAQNPATENFYRQALKSLDSNFRACYSIPI